LGAGSIIIEPLVELAASPKASLNPNIPNEDSASFEFDETTLFAINRFPGYDLLEGGERMDVGGRATVDFGGGRNFSLLVGRVYRTEPDLAFNAISGLQGKSSDWVSAATFTPIPGLSFFARTRSDADTWKVREEEAGANVLIGRSSISVRYNYNENGVEQIECATTTCASPFGGQVINGSTVIGRVQSAEISGQTFFTKHWGLYANVTRDLQTRIFPVAQFSVFYQDECIRFDLLYTHDEIYSTVIGTSNSVTFRLTLATLGGTLAPGQTKPYDGR
jgi:LPS-assembly protein